MMSSQSTLMAAEAREAPAVVARQLEANRAICEQLRAVLSERPPALVCTCARGSSDHAATFVKYLVETALGVPVTSAAPSIGSVYGRPMRYDGALFVVISQSGRSPDLLANAGWAKRNGAYVVALLNEVDSPLAEVSDLVLPVHAGPERSVAATKSFIGALTAALQAVAHIGEHAGLLGALDVLPAQLETAVGLDWSEAVVPLAAADDLLVVGRGLALGIAQECALKLKETAAIHAEAFSAAELMHGPLALVRERYPLLVLSQADETRPGVEALIESLREKGARVFAAEAGPRAPYRLPVVPDMHPATAPVAMVQSFYLLADAIARARGFDPDRPAHLHKVTETR